MANVAILVDNDFEDDEFSVPYARIVDADHNVTILGISADQEIKGKRGKSTIITERAIDNARPEDFDALVIPGGYSPDHLRMNKAAVAFTRVFMASGKPLAAICHGPQLLIEADVVKNKTLTSWPSVRTDLVNAGATWIDESVVEDGNLITSRKPGDLNVFCHALLKRLQPDTGQ
ncbi:MAG: type 1 glutamine amidotransferase domain-containing protein [Gammaproteobacteria bacterium]|jgi:protease I